LANPGFDTNDFLNPSFDVFSSPNGVCDSFCQNAKRLDNQSINKFEKDLRSFEAQFGQTKAGSFVPQTQGRTNLFGQDVSNNIPTVGDVFTFTNTKIRPNSFDNTRPKTVPTFRRKAITTQKPRSTPFTVFNKPSPTTTMRPTQRTTRKQTKATRKRTTPSTTVTTTKTSTPTTVSSTTEKEKVKNSNTVDFKTSVSIPLEATTQKNTKIKFTFNGKTIGNSKSGTSSNKAKEMAEERNGEDLPISTFFNESDESNDIDSNREERKMAGDENDFPVFDAVPE